MSKNMCVYCIVVWKKDLITSYDIDTAKLAEECTEFMKKYDTEKAVVSMS